MVRIIRSPPNPKPTGIQPFLEQVLFLQLPIREFDKEIHNLSWN
ncbi:hypothetical protein [Scytonema sp. UIC 10036]|nr:hypothetical protein [Scytonema sp. UIC 10036]